MAQSRDLLGGVVHIGHGITAGTLHDHRDHRTLAIGGRGHLLRPHTGEKRRKFVKLHPFPSVGLVVVALGALDLHTHEDPRNLSRHLDRPGFVRQGKGDGTILVITTGGRDQP